MATLIRQTTLAARLSTASRIIKTSSIRLPMITSRHHTSTEPTNVRAVPQLVRTLGADLAVTDTKPDHYNSLSPADKYVIYSSTGSFAPPSRPDLIEALCTSHAIHSWRRIDWSTNAARSIEVPAGTAADTEARPGEEAVHEEDESCEEKLYDIHVDCSLDPILCSNEEYTLRTGLDC